MFKGLLFKPKSVDFNTNQVQQKLQLRFILFKILHLQPLFKRWNHGGLSGVRCRNAGARDLFIYSNQPAGKSSHPSEIRQQWGLSVCPWVDPSTSTSSFGSRWCFLLNMLPVNLLFINPNGVNECQSGRGRLGLALINMISHIQLATH